MNLLLPLFAFVLAVVIIFYVLPGAQKSLGKRQPANALWATVWGRGLLAAGGGLLIAGAAGPLLGQSVRDGLITACGLILGFCGGRVALNFRGDAEVLAEAAWAAQGLRTPAPRLQARLVGGGTVLIGMVMVAFGTAGLLS